MSTYGTNKQVGVGGGGGGAGANKQLSNLTNPTAVNQDLQPSTPGGVSLGNSTNFFDNGYIGTIHTTAINNLVGNAGISMHVGGGGFALTAQSTGAINFFTDAGGSIGLITPLVSLSASTVDMGGGPIINLLNPVNPQDAATKAYVDASAGTGTVTTVSVVSANGLAGTVATATSTPAITLSTTITGILQGNGTAISAATLGNLTDAGTDGIVVTGGTGAVLGSGTSIAQHVADSTHNGYLSSADWATFNGKQAAGNYITALTGDVTAAGPGSAAATLATVNANVGSFGDATHVAAVTVNGKGLVTAAASTLIQIAESQVTNLTTDLAAKVTNPMSAAGDMIAGGSSGTPTRVAAVASAGQVPITGASGTSVAFGTLPGNATVLKAPKITALLSTGTTTGYLFTISTSTTCAVNDTYTNNGNTYTVLSALSAQSGQVLFMSGASSPTNANPLVRATGSGTSSIGILSNVPLATFTSATSPAPLYTKIKMAGGGSGGSGSGTVAGSNGTAAGTTVFGSLLLLATGGVYNPWGSGGSNSGSTSTINTPATGFASAGGVGGTGGIAAPSTQNNVGGFGGWTPFGGGGAGVFAGNSGQPAIANTGGGGSGGSSAVGVANNYGGNGGNSGAYLEALIPAPAATYVYAIGAGGTAGGAGTNGTAGGAGAAGIIVVEENFQ